MSGLPFPEKCVKYPEIPCPLFQHGSWHDPDKCSQQPCKSIREAKENGIVLKVTGGSKRPYADTLTNYQAILLTKKTEEEVREYLAKHFWIGPNWYENKLEGFRPLADGSGYAFTIRDPYKD